MAFPAQKIFLAGLLSISMVAMAFPAEEPRPGIVVSSIAAHSVAERSGLREGDILQSWNAGEAQGSLESPFDLLLVETEQLPRGRIVVTGWRGNEQQQWTFEPGRLGLKTRPDFPSALLLQYQQGEDLLSKGNLAKGTERWRAAADQTSPSESALLPMWLLFHVAEIFAENRDWQNADNAYEEVLARAEKERPQVRALLLRAWGDTFKQRGDWANAQKHYREAEELIREIAPDSLLRANLLDLQGEAERHLADLTRSEQHFSRAMEIQSRLSLESLDLANSLCGLGNIAKERGELDKAQNLQNRAVQIRERLAPGSLDLAASFNGLGNLALPRNDLDQAEKFFRKSLNIREELSPGSLEVSTSLNNLGTVSWGRGDLDEAEQYQTKALDIALKIAPESPNAALSLSNLGGIAGERGDLIKAEKYITWALGIQQRIAPVSFDAARTLDSLGAVVAERGDYLKAEEYQLQALAILEKLAPENPEIALDLINLSQGAEVRNDLGKAEQYAHRALAIGQKYAPKGEDVARTLDRLSSIALKSGAPRQAEAYQRRALAIWAKVAPGTLDHAIALNDLGNVLRARGDRIEAAKYYLQALEARQKLAPGGSDVADSLHALGDLYLEEGKLTEAENMYQQSRTVLEKLAPESKQYGEVLAGLARIAVSKGRLDDAASLFEDALKAMEAQVHHWSGSEEMRSGLRAGYSKVYQDYIELLIKTNRPEIAFNIFERSRARSFLEILAERDLAFEVELPPELRRARLENFAKYDRIEDELMKLDPKRDENKRSAELSQQLRELQDEREQIAANVRKASPHFAALQYPKPLDAAAARQALDPGTVLLAYSVGEQETILFVVSNDSGTAHGGVSVFHLPLREKRLRRKVEAVRRLLQSWNASDTRAFAIASQALYRSLVAPAEGTISGATRVLIVPDGPLQILPFAALLRDRKHYLMEWKPIHTAVSVTVYAELKSTTTAMEPNGVQLTAFGDPKYPPADAVQTAAAHNLELRSAIEGGNTLTPLPFSRDEVNSIAGLFPHHSQVFLGDDATERNAKNVGKDTRYLHFAAHAILDERFPLNSALVLTIPDHLSEGQENGLLQAWEIFEQVHLNADLVTLSACKTGLGKEIKGEGLIGLTRAFEYAGAHSVLASLWSIPDVSTAEFMKRFYGHLKEGRGKDQALQQAQIDFLHLRQFSRPLYWAAFFIDGDWR
ncbi:MAG TPA: CHAT domain-containing protein [Terriglobales bacterium]|nr:CHAT domain-containing protein [Terriglobales bacterium]